MKTLCLLMPLLLFLTAGCVHDNNYMNGQMFADRLNAAGLQVKSIRELDPTPFRATAGWGIMVDNSELGLYKFDPNSRLGKERLKQVTETERLYIQGIPYPVAVSGSFALMGLDKHRKKRQILKVFNNFY